ncbi:hypothetical protein [Streptomyces sp. NPDC051162]|uniref:hypothetical protein n=1 Tax=unclassified Streptomyces TaxID=2593676 RepID=UPI0034270B71
MSAKHRIAAATVLTAAVAAVVWPTAGAFAAGAADGKDGHPGRPTTVRQIQLPDGSRARLTSGEGGTKATVTTHGKQQRTIDTTRPAADIDRLHLRIIGGDTARPTLRAAVDGTEEPSYYDFTSGSLVKDEVKEQPKDHQRGTKAAPGHATRTGHDGRSQHGDPHTRTATPTAAADHRGKVRAASSNPVKRVVEAGEAIKGRHDIGTPAIAGAALLAAGGGAYGVRIALRRSGRTGTDA